MTAPSPRPTPDLPESIETVHIIGICGTAMAALAGMLQHQGVNVAGSDAMAYPPVSDLLNDLGIPIRQGYRAEHLTPAPDLVVVGNVCRRDNPEAVEMRRRGLPHLSLPEVLRLRFMVGKAGVVPTGTHGKTTTCSLVAWLLRDAGRDPSFMIGGVPGNFGSNYRLGEGDVFVAEGDEYDTAYFDKVPKFWHYPARFATINNIEFDHADIYTDTDEIEWVFSEFAKRVEGDGSLWVNGEDPRACRAGRHTSARLGTFGLDQTCDAFAEAVQYGESGTRFEVVRRGQRLGPFLSPLYGEYNLRNTLGAVLLALDAGVGESQVAAALPRFKGVMKRLEVKGEEAGVLVIDDFAHHPTAVGATLRAIRQRYPTRRIWAAFEAKSNTSRRAVFQTQYGMAFADVDHVVLSQPWKADNLPDEQRLSLSRLADDIRASGPQVDLIPAVDDIVAFLAGEVQRGDVVVGLSGSNFGGLHGKLLDRLRAG